MHKKKSPQIFTLILNANINQNNSYKEKAP